MYKISPAKKRKEKLGPYAHYTRINIGIVGRKLTVRDIHFTNGSVCPGLT